MSILAALAATTKTEVRIGMITWRLKRATPRDLMDHGLPGILVLREIVDPVAAAAARKAEAVASGNAPEPSKGRPVNPDESPADRLHRQLLRTTTAQKDKAAQAGKHFAGLVCATTTHIRVDGQFEEGSKYEDGDVGGWLPVRVVTSEHLEDTKKGSLWVGNMPPGTVDKLYPLALRLCAPAEVQASLRRFLPEPPTAPDDSAGV